MIDQIVHHIIPAAYSVLPRVMQSPKATAQLLAIGLIESGFRERRQLGGGPARGFWSFERGGGVKGVVTHPDTRDALRVALVALRYEKDIGQTVALYQHVEHNDVLACVFARLLLWTVPARLPGRADYDESWRQYMESWRPGRPHRAAWNANFDQAWSIVTATTPEETTDEP
jgi:hypothetical protein